ncbi:AbiV family abortive infection protein [Azospirillum himalayense]|uniref:AbiV family abortive infection protein n=1 Tax=Azospirillum himalayense TaxID=654847 RepID=A0ABW0GA79_9PROT
MSDEKRAPGDAGLAAVEAAIAYGGGLYGELKVEDFNAAFDHVVSLLEDAATLFAKGAPNTAAFLAITAIEETAKAHVAIFRKDLAEGRAKGRDPLLDHKAKHRMAITPTVFMGERLVQALGRDACARLQTEAEGGGFTATREAGLYCARVNGRFTTPRAAVPPERAWELLLLAIETLDDALIGYSDHSLTRADHVASLFERIAAAKPGGSGHGDVVDTPAP